MTTTWAYLFHQPGADPARDRMTLEGGGLRSIVVAVPSVDDAPALAKALVADEGVLLIEVCGAFSNADAVRVSEAVGPQIPVGHTMYAQEATPGLGRFGAALGLPS